MHAVQPILRWGQHNIQVSVRYWLFYVRFVLEDDAMRQQFAGKRNLTTKQFRELMKPTLCSAPSFTRGSTLKAKRLRRDMLAVLRFYHDVLLSGKYPWVVRRCAGRQGIGLFATRSFNWTARLAQMLFGALCYVSNDEFGVLQHREYPSLFAGNAILYGPLSLINHRCDAALAFGEPDGELGATIGDGLFEDIECIQLRSARSKRKKRRRISFTEGKELTAQYGMDALDFTCEAPCCTHTM